MKQINIVVIGAGNRGNIYSSFCKDKIKSKKINIIGVCEPNKIKREKFAKEYNLKSNIFENYEEFFKNKNQHCNAVFICTQDNDHLEPLLKSIEYGYDILVEKPVVTNVDDYNTLIKALENNTSSKIMIAHVLRYTNFFKTLKSILNKREIGKIRSITHFEDIGFFHFTHSYVRGNWKSSLNSSPIILAKCCHDLDILNWLVESTPLEVNSYGELNYFISKSAPKNSSKKCFNCIYKDDCVFSAFKIYNKESKWTQKTNIEQYDSIIEMIKQSNYGDCVYYNTNNVPDYMSTHLIYPENIHIQFEMNALSKKITRNTRIFGSHGEIEADFNKNKILIKKFWGQNEEIIVNSGISGHGGGDLGCVEGFVELINGNIEVDVFEVLKSHYIALKIEESRVNKKSIKL